MKIKDVFIRSRVQLEGVYYNNCFPIEEQPKLELILEDCIRDYQLTQDGFFIIKFERHVFSDNEKLDIRVVFAYSAKLQSNVKLSEEEIADIVKKDKDAFLSFTVADASLIISNIFKAAGLPVCITEPFFHGEKQV